MKFDLGGANGGYVPGTDIFLSYARQDRPTARMFADCLREEGFDVWWDASLRSGQTFDEEIERNLRDSKAVVVLWSPASVASRWVRAEATLADRRNKLAPAIIQPCDRPIIFELTHTTDLSDWTGELTDMRWQTFVHDLRRLVEAKLGDSSTPEPEPQPSARQPLRPGYDDVILAKQPSPSPPLRRAAAPPPIVEEPAPLGDMHCLEFEDLKAAGIVIDKSGVKIGRTSPADIVLSDRSVSREHCMIGLANDELIVTDLNSTNGTYVDGVRISRATILPVGSTVRLGEVSLKHALRSRGDAEGRGGSPGASRGRGMEPGRLAATS